MKTIFGFYVHHRANGVPFYVGKGTETRSRLFCRRNQFHKNIVKKDGRGNITITFTPCSSEQEAFEKEIALISLYRILGIELANATDGGEGPSNPKPEVRAKISNTMKRAWQNPETRQALLAAVATPERRAKSSANGRLRKGKPLSPEHRAKISKSQTGVSRGVGRKASPETRAKLSAFHKMRYQDPAEREKQGKAHRGKKHSIERRNKIGAAHKKLWENPEYRETHKTSAEQKAKIGEKSKALWATPEYREKVIKAVTGRKHSPESRKKMSESQKETLSRPEVKKKRIEASNTPEARAEYKKRAKAYWASPEAHKTASDRFKMLWATPEYRERVIEARKKKKITNCEPLTD